MTSRRKAARVLLTGLATLAAIAVLGEILLRSFWPERDDGSVYARIKEQFSVPHAPYVPDPDLGALVAPSQTNVVVTPNFTYTLRTDHAGFPNREPWPEQVDVAVLGNSLITGSGVGYEGQFTTLLGAALGGRSVLNLGIPGGGVEHELRAYRKFAAPLRPKLVVATLWLVWELDNGLKFEDWLHQDPRPDFTTYRMTYEDWGHGSGAGGVRLIDRARYLAVHLAGKSRLLHACWNWLAPAHAGPQYVEEAAVDSGDVMLLSWRNEARLLQGWERDGPIDVRAIFYAPLETLRREVESQGGTFLVALFPSKEELYAGKKLPGLLKVVDEARAELARRGIATIDLYPVFERHAGAPPFYTIDMHPNALGHRLVAAALAQWVREHQVFPAPAPRY